jgi:hypothetical protein
VNLVTLGTAISLVFGARLAVLLVSLVDSSPLGV